MNRTSIWYVFISFLHNLLELPERPLSNNDLDDDRNQVKKQMKRALCHTFGNGMR